MPVKLATENKHFALESRKRERTLHIIKCSAQISLLFFRASKLLRHTQRTKNNTYTHKKNRRNCLSAQKLTLLLIKLRLIYLVHNHDTPLISDHNQIYDIKKK